MNELTEFGAENNALARRYGSQTPLVFTMASDAFPIVPAGFRDMDEEVLTLRGDAARAAAAGTAAAVVGRFSAVGLANPSGSGVIGVIEGIEVTASVASQNFIIRVQAAAVSALQGASQGVPMDSRRLSELVSIRTVLTDEAAEANFGSGLQVFQVSAGVSRFIEFPYVLAPLSTVWVVGRTVNQALTVSYRWRQRRIVSQEAGS